MRLSRRTLRLHGFGPVTRAERRAADAFFATLLGSEIHRAARHRRPAPDAELAEDRPLFKGPLDEGDFRAIIRMLENGKTDSGLDLTADAQENALAVAAHVWCSHNAIDLDTGDPLLCLLPRGALHDPRVKALIPHVEARGPIVNWPAMTEDQRIRIVMRLLVDRGYAVDGAAGMVGNMMEESAVLPQAVEGGLDRKAPMRAPGFDGRKRTFTALEVMNRNERTGTGPASPGVGLVQFTDAPLRAALFTHVFRGTTLGPRILFDIEAQIDFLVGVLGNKKAALDQSLRTARSSEAAARAFLFQFENPANAATKVPKRRQNAAHAKTVHLGT